jgi:hypothetical protein
MKWLELAGARSSASTHSRPPWTMFKTPGERPAFFSSRAIMIAVSGTFSLGFSTKVFPQTNATGYIQSGTIAGKFNGVIPTQTPKGWRIVSQSFPRAMFSSVSRLSNDGMLQANSTTSMPRRTSPRDSIKVLPCFSRVAARDIFKILLEQHFETEQHSRALYGRRFPPTRKCRRCRLHGIIHMRRGAHWRERDHLPC